MNLKLKISNIFVAVSMLILLASCNKEDEMTARPVINILEIGLDNSKIAFIGGDFHIEAEIIAVGRIEKILVELHSEDGEDEIEFEFLEFGGLKNTDFHQHIDIPSDLTPGEYHFHLVVIDQEGNVTKAEDEVLLVELLDEDPPVINITSSLGANQVFSYGEILLIEGEISDNNRLAGLLVALVRANENWSNSEVTGDNPSIIVILHTHSFDSDTSHSFNASIEIGATNDNNMVPAPITGDNDWQSGNYYILIKAKDAKGNWGYSNHYPITLNF